MRQFNGTNNQNDSDKGIYSVAYKNPDGQIIVVVQNELSKRHRLAVAVDGKGINTEVPAHSITTFIVDKYTQNPLITKEKSGIFY